MPSFVVYNAVDRTYSRYVADDAHSATLEWAKEHIPEQVKCNRLPKICRNYAAHNWLETRVDRGRIRAGYEKSKDNLEIGEIKVIEDGRIVRENNIC